MYWSACIEKRERCIEPIYAQKTITLLEPIYNVKNEHQVTTVNSNFQLKSLTCEEEVWHSSRTNQSCSTERSIPKAPAFHEAGEGIDNQAIDNADNLPTTLKVTESEYYEYKKGNSITGSRIVGLDWQFSNEISSSLNQAEESPNARYTAPQCSNT